MTNYQKKISLGIIIIIVISIYFYALHPTLTFENFKHHKDELILLVQSHYYGALLLYCLSYILVITFSLPIAFLISLVGGFLFGTFIGTCAIVISATIGATLSFLITRYLFRAYLQQRYQKELILFNKEIRNYGSYYLLFMHFIPFIPFFVINCISALSKISLKKFILMTSIGVIPTSLLYAAAGNQFAKFDTYSSLYSWKVIILFILFILLSLAPIIIGRKKIIHKE